MLDLMLSIAGERPATVTAVGNRICTSGSGFKYNDFMAATYKFPSGLIGRLTSNYGCVHRHHHVLRIYGTKATFLYDDAGARVHKTRDENQTGIPIGHSPLPSHKGNLLPDFVEMVRRQSDTKHLAIRNFDLVGAVVAADSAAANNCESSIEYV